MENPQDLKRMPKNTYSKGNLGARQPIITFEANKGTRKTKAKLITLPKDDTCRKFKTMVKTVIGNVSLVLFAKLHES
ncbi:hypothetical protein ACJMK2_006196 [Sinanodonta woodiana]|uniref:Uncharacterized protein n=1 Tax=Sinanodonta woodiana TaxID=1069815 RepID=A0ABD3VSN2_SINWO